MANKEEVEQENGRIATARHPDFFVVQASGANQLAISLGTYRTEEAANAGLETLRAKGVKSAKWASARGRPPFHMHLKSGALKHRRKRCVQAIAHACRRPVPTACRVKAESAMSFIVGLTGGIGSGKSTVAELFAERGAALVDTDAIAHALTAAAGRCHGGDCRRFRRQRDCVPTAPGPCRDAQPGVLRSLREGKTRSHPASPDPAAERALRGCHAMRPMCCWWFPCWSKRAAIASAPIASWSSTARGRCRFLASWRVAG
jgi:hypothetical protein